MHGDDRALHLRRQQDQALADLSTSGMVVVIRSSLETRSAVCALGKAIVYLQTMKNQQLTPAAHLRPGDSISLLLTGWTDAEAQYGGINRGELEGENLLLEEPNFAELAP